MKLEEMVGKRMTEAQFDEAAGEKDACYRKVKARYDVWPSAYASGALVKCRKVGAKNWGNKSKKESVDEVKLNEIKMDMKNFTDKLLNALEGDTAGLYFGIKHNNKIEKMVGDIMDVDTYYQVKDKKEMIKGLKKVKSHVAKIKSLNKSIFDKVLSDIDTAHKTFEVNIQKRIKISESVNEGIFGKFDTGAGFKGNGMTVYDRNQEKSGDFRDIVHIAPNGKITIYDKNVKKEPKLMQSLNKISQEFKKAFKESVNESAVGEHHQAITKFILTALSKAGIKIIKVQMMKKSWLQGRWWYGGFFTVRSSNMVDMPGQGKVKRSSAVLPFYVDKKGNVNLQVSPKDYIIGKYPDMSKVVKNLKDFKKSDLDESVNEGMDKRQAGETLKQLGGNKFIMMTGAKNFAVGPKGMGFKIGRNSKGVNYIRIDLDRGRDLYNMEFIQMRGGNLKIKSKVKGVYNDQLQKIFTKHTGMYTSLGTMGR